MLEPCIPDFSIQKLQKHVALFSEMARRELLFQPDDGSRDYYVIETGKRMFKNTECAQLYGMVADMFDRLHEGVYGIVELVFLEAVDIQPGLDD